MNLDAQPKSSRFAQLVEQTSHPDWDNEGGVVIDATRWKAAQSLAEAVRAEIAGVPEAFFSASGDGGIFIKWADATRSLEAEMDGATFHWVVRTASGRTRSQSDHAGDLIQAIRSLFA